MAETITFPRLVLMSLRTFQLRRRSRNPAPDYVTGSLVVEFMAESGE
jgi:hypothetical protein